MDYTCYSNEEEHNIENYPGSKGQKKTEGFKSKNLITERKRRLKNHEGLMALRALVPNITNLKKETAIDDAITYIKELQKHQNALSDQLAEMEATFEKEVKQEKRDNITYGIENLKIKDDVKVTQINENKLWVEIICENKPGVFTRLMETITGQGIEVTDMNFTTSKGLTLVLFGIKVTNGEMAAAKQVKLYFKKLMRVFIDHEDRYRGK
ncbi:Transcription factor like [Thalictrum thalictroides]|uniref:Transcription factor like n=1 Tax=Thalictrum thalictroides TaxID=46969 RepID=A0A7J6VV92_THATH|nr:Transcription factor like [Thalictrum thalictroides]